MRSLTTVSFKAGDVIFRQARRKCVACTCVAKPSGEAGRRAHRGRAAVRRSRVSSARYASRQGDEGDAIYFLDVGECVATIALLSFEVGARVEHKKHGVGTVAEVTTEAEMTTPMSMCMCIYVRSACCYIRAARAL